MRRQAYIGGATGYEVAGIEEARGYEETGTV